MMQIESNTQTITHSDANRARRCALRWSRPLRYIAMPNHNY